MSNMTLIRLERRNGETWEGEVTLDEPTEGHRVYFRHVVYQYDHLLNAVRYVFKEEDAASPTAIWDNALDKVGDGVELS